MPNHEFRIFSSKQEVDFSPIIFAPTLWSKKLMQYKFLDIIQANFCFVKECNASQK